MGKEKIYRVFILGDTHTPNQDDLTLSAIEKFMADIFIDEYVHLGDLMDFDMISSFNADNLRENETRRLVSDYNLANKILDRHQKIVRKNNKNAKFTLLEGNHENRIQRVIDKSPEVEGLLEVPKNLRLAERGFKWIPSWTEGELYKIGKLYFMHGKWTNQYHAAKVVNAYAVNMVYGHTHDVMNHVRVILGKDRHIMAQSLGHTADENKLKYMKKGPSNWTQAVGIAEIRPGGSFNLYPITIINHTFSFNGKVYAP